LKFGISFKIQLKGVFYTPKNTIYNKTKDENIYWYDTKEGKNSMCVSIIKVQMEKEARKQNQD